MAPARTPRLLLAGCALFAAAACGAPTHTSSAPAAVHAAPVVPAGCRPADGTLAFGVEHTFADGVTITVASPKSFQPSASAYPRSDRAAAFQIELRNAGSLPYRLSRLSVSAMVTGTQAIQVVDSTQGFDGIADAGTDLIPGRTVRLNLAFAVPPRPAELRFILRPDAASSTAATYCGLA